ncbi:MAG: Lrp/AsnC family transcriptional regulator [Candidatus Scalindua sp. AMX11]|nr:MAG: Lrp/AsnC family transcriptional regulator [Candidatus Scalindua sp.]NOG83035.1 AsnC family transcriptional regulator [Planctomycetota bacterium]RZV79565.1 MAG: Lrp/AsnC family transcriptional regulator [Candidatus Scalindua sp. SCAELEC01]TDE65204.1 MAG: Lrp/AsnC family transcriptional regulator [Candidatus Scalindua sp. AMX11]GJQ58560.1 MAG: AsnC family transcriptional regulator [Candidatus Scalindua sp.]
MTLSTTDKKILQRIQTNLPLTNRPFRDLAEELELDEDLVIERIKFMIDGKYVRRLAPIINTQAVGNSATLAAIQVPDDKIEEVGEIINGYSGVSHNYLRKGRNRPIPLNMWFTMSAPSNEELQENIKEIENRTGLKVRCLPTTKKFKIGVKFKIY